MEGLSVDAMLVSHLHGDHFSLPHIKKLSPKKLYLGDECIELLGGEVLASEIVSISGKGVFSVGNFSVMAFTVDHGPNVKVRPRENFGFLVTEGGQKLYFGGDIFYPSGMPVAGSSVDYACLPIGGFYTFGPKEALNFAKTFGRIGTVVPMHYQKDQTKLEEFKVLAKATESGINIF